MEIRLIVIRTAEPEKLAEFYSWLGLEFEYHKHGNSPYHYAAMVGSMTLEIYPLTKSQVEADKYLRLGFAIDEFETKLELLKSKGLLINEPVSTEFGYMTVISDLDGRKIELYKKHS